MNEKDKLIDVTWGDLDVFKIHKTTTTQNQSGGWSIKWETIDIRDPDSCEALDDAALELIEEKVRKDCESGRTNN